MTDMDQLKLITRSTATLNRLFLPTHPSCLWKFLPSPSPSSEPKLARLELVIDLSTSLPYAERLFRIIQIHSHRTLNPHIQPDFLRKDVSLLSTLFPDEVLGKGFERGKVVENKDGLQELTLDVTGQIFWNNTAEAKHGRQEWSLYVLRIFVRRDKIRLMDFRKALASFFGENGEVTEQFLRKTLFMPMWPTPMPESKGSVESLLELRRRIEIAEREQSNVVMGERKDSGPGFGGDGAEDSGKMPEEIAGGKQKKRTSSTEDGEIIEG